VAPLASICAALVLVLLLVAPTLANQGPTKLYDAAVSPRAGTPTTTIAFEVWYRNREGSAPDHVSVVIDGVAHAMTGSGGTNWKAGVKNTWSTTLPAGTHTISFEAADTRRFSDSIAGGTVTITAPPKPSPTPTATPAATPRPSATPRPTSAPTATPRPTATPTATPTPAPSAGSGSTASPNPTGSAGPTSTPPGEPGSSSAPGATPLPGATDDPAVSPGPADPGATHSPDDTTGGGPSLGWSDGWGDGGGGSTGASGGPTGGTGGLDPSGVGPGSAPTAPQTLGVDGTDGRGSGPSSGRDVVSGGPAWGAFASALQTLGIDRPPTVTIVPMLVGTAGATTMAFAFAIFGKKRRDKQPPAPDEVLQANAARADESLPGVVRGSTIPAPVDAEAGMPRWRRPSLLEARKADPARSSASAQQRMSFERGANDAADGRERRVIRYRVVRLLDAPDELRSADVGQLDQGDEVQLLEKSGSYWLVLCPDGRQGWLHKMTLGEVVSDAAPSGLGGRDGEDDDVLTALLTARARA
jgi:hypothetical protein